MGFKAVAAMIAVALFGLYFTPIVLKLREPSLAVVVLGGLLFAAYDGWKSISNGHADRRDARAE